MKNNKGIYATRVIQNVLFIVACVVYHTGCIKKVQNNTLLYIIKRLTILYHTHGSLYALRLAFMSYVRQALRILLATDYTPQPTAVELNGALHMRGT